MGRPCEGSPGSMGEAAVEPPLGRRHESFSRQALFTDQADFFRHCRSGRSYPSEQCGCRDRRISARQGLSQRRGKQRDGGRDLGQWPGHRRENQQGHRADRCHVRQAHPQAQHRRIRRRRLGCPSDIADGQSRAGASKRRLSAVGHRCRKSDRLSQGRRRYRRDQNGHVTG